MSRFALFLSLSVLALTHGWTPLALAGDEDGAQEKKKVEAKIPEDTALPKDEETPAMSVGESAEPSPDFKEPERPAKKRRMEDEDLDARIDYSHLLDSVETTEAGRGVLAPALGFRGYRPSMIAVGAGDRTPGYGGMIEFSWNRIGAGIFGSYRAVPAKDLIVNPNAFNYGMAGLYGLYRWLPFDISPYFLLGVEAGFNTDEPFGGMLGGGVETKIYSGLTLLFGWTFHSTVHRGFLGGALGWSF